MQIFKGKSPLNSHWDVLPTDKKLMKLIWKYLRLDDKLNCRLVCKRFNKIVSEMDGFLINVYFPSKVQKIPKLTSNHQTIIIQHLNNLNCQSLELEVHQMLNQFKDSLIHLKLLDCKFHMMPLYEMLSELPMLKSLTLNTKLTMRTSIDLTKDDQLKLLNIEEMINNYDFGNKILDNARNGLKINIKTLLDDETFSINKFKNSIKKSSGAQSLKFMKWIIKKAEIMSTCITYYFNSNILISSMDDTSFDWLKQLNDLHLIDEFNEMMNLLKSKCIDELTGSETNITAEQKNILLEKIRRHLKENRLASIKQLKEYNGIRDDVEDEEREMLTNYIDLFFL